VYSSCVNLWNKLHHELAIHLTCQHTPVLTTYMKIQWRKWSRDQQKLLSNNPSAKHSWSQLWGCWKFCKPFITSMLQEMVTQEITCGIQLLCAKIFMNPPPCCWLSQNISPELCEWETQKKTLVRVMCWMCFSKMTRDSARWQEIQQDDKRFSTIEELVLQQFGMKTNMTNNATNNATNTQALAIGSK